ncbi:hypothetical protein [Haloarcula sediminis]|uniref:hypothetical protein n=1 Tax=Haloarcula sediminis TaxID=3111777 RepID=UPI002D793A61|nr:hypothetical protein [Haloarcula sp. CK38]
MATEQRFERVCRLMNKVLEQRDESGGGLRLEADEVAELLSALRYYRSTVDPSSGDVLIGTTYTCPECGSNETFRAQDSQVSIEQAHPDIGLEVVRVHGIAQCSSCMFQVDLKQFEPVRSGEFDEDSWSELYKEAYRERERVETLQPK